MIVAIQKVLASFIQTVRRVRLSSHCPLGFQARTSLGAARPLPPSADIGPGGQSVGQAAQFCLGRRVASPVTATTDFLATDILNMCGCAVPEEASLFGRTLGTFGRMSILIFRTYCVSISSGSSQSISYIAQSAHAACCLNSATRGPSRPSSPG